jgi:AbrB family looped-hinge helix DNA binding protein
MVGAYLASVLKVPHSEKAPLSSAHYRGNESVKMTQASSKLTAQGQVSVPAEVRRKLGLGPGSTLEWKVEGDRAVVRRAGKYSSEDVHAALFRKRHVAPKTLAELREGVRSAVKKRHAGG